MNCTFRWQRGNICVSRIIIAHPSHFGRVYRSPSWSSVENYSFFPLHEKNNSRSISTRRIYGPAAASSSRMCGILFPLQVITSNLYERHVLWLRCTGEKKGRGANQKKPPGVPNIELFEALPVVRLGHVALPASRLMAVSPCGKTKETVGRQRTADQVLICMGHNGQV